MGFDDLGALIFLVILGAIFFAPEMLLVPVFFAFGGMMETSKSRPLVHVGIALALGGPVLIAVTILLAGLCVSAGFCWTARFFGAAALSLFLTWVVAGVVVGIVKSRIAAREQKATAKAKLPE